MLYLFAWDISLNHVTVYGRCAWTEGKLVSKERSLLLLHADSGMHFPFLCLVSKVRVKRKISQIS